MNFRKTAMRAFAASALAVGVAFGAAAAPAAANPDTHLDVQWLFPPTVNFLGQNDLCTATIEFRVEKNPAVEDTVTLIVDGYGAKSPLPSWNESSTCRVELHTYQLPANHAPYMRNGEYTVVEVPAERTEVLRKDYAAGDGPDSIAVMVDFIHNYNFRFLPQFAFPGGATGHFDLR